MVYKFYTGFELNKVVSGDILHNTARGLMILVRFFRSSILNSGRLKQD